MKDIAIYKLARIEQAIDDLSRAVERLERAAQSRPTPVAVVEDEDMGESESEAALRREVEGLRADYENLRTISRTISGRLDSTIDRVRGVLDAP
ncbi:MAG: hypothetical protein K9H25_01020 [Rhodospirillum sp.]|nr:hypothetical protein [Rhodospirillum sp.]MCF8488026.1 hypothetical protein [Rhodospirillum sp.]MCF8500293.1 hypothetical protein [Rhodospirillum sp.]